MVSIDDVRAESAARLARLPRWAQDRIRRAEQRIADLTAEVERMAGELPQSDTYREDIVNERHLQLGDGATIVFQVQPRASDSPYDHRGQLEARIVERHGAPRRLEIQAAEGAVVIRSMSSNAVALDVDGR